jgi:hydrogenase maturation protease
VNRKILIAGIGNIFLGDDAFGVEAVRALGRRPLPEGVSAVDYGIRGFDLAYALLDPPDAAPWDAVILIDALARGGSPGTLYTLRPDLDSLQAPQLDGATVNPHAMDPAEVLRLAFSMGTVSAEVYVVGCEPADFGDELEGRMGLSAIVAASIDGAVEMVEDLVDRIRSVTGVGGIPCRTR